MKRKKSDSWPPKILKIYKVSEEAENFGVKSFIKFLVNLE